MSSLKFLVAKVEERAAFNRLFGTAKVSDLESLMAYFTFEDYLKVQYR